MTRPSFAAASLILLAAWGAGPVRLPAADSVAELQARFDRETNSGRKAKLLAKLGNVQFTDSRRAGDAGDYQTVGLLMEKYRDNVREAIQLVRKDHPRAEKDYGGYRVIEVSVRKSLRELDETILVAPQDYRPPLQIVRKDLEEIHEELLRLLFPRRPGEKPVTPPNPPPH
jgi:hypothetical protein